MKLTRELAFVAQTEPILCLRLPSTKVKTHYNVPGWAHATLQTNRPLPVHFYYSSPGSSTDGRPGWSVAWAEHDVEVAPAFQQANNKQTVTKDKMCTLTTGPGARLTPFSSKKRRRASIRRAFGSHLARKGQRKNDRSPGAAWCRQCIEAIAINPSNLALRPQLISQLHDRMSCCFTAKLTGETDDWQTANGCEDEYQKQHPLAVPAK